MNTNKIKQNFPIFKKKINNNPLVYLDSANSSQKPKSVIDRMSYFYANEFSNVGRSVHSLAVTATNRFEETRDLVKKFINAKHREEIIFTKGATEGINLVANSYGDKFIHEGDEIILTELEHHSNYVPWHYLRNRKKAVIKFAKINENLEIKVDEIKLMSFTTYYLHLIFSSIPSLFSPNLILYILPALTISILFFSLKIMFFKTPKLRKVK